MVVTVFKVLLTILLVGFVWWVIFYKAEDCNWGLDDILIRLKHKEFAPVILAFLIFIVGVMASIFLAALIFGLISPLWWILVGSVACFLPLVFI